jgi:ubiquinone/menaquinone biosynthesis C-methylase UbiE
MFNEAQAKESKFLAQFIAFAPVVFQVARCLRDFNILKTIDSAPEGLTFEELKEKLKEESKMTKYGLSILLDAGESASILSRDVSKKYKLSQIGYFLLHDQITNINMNFTQDVCYQGLFNLEESIKNEKPEGLKVFGNWSTIYEGLTQLPEKTQKSWFDFDHYYSDESFPRALPIVLKNKPKKILDVGGNTGKFAFACAAESSEIQITILDHPAQIELAKKKAEDKGVENQVKGIAMNLLDHSIDFPKDYDVIWMSQFLDCFSEEDIFALLKRAADSMNENSRLFIMETFIDRQKFDIAKFCLDMTSIYFTAMANGKSRMYRATDFLSLIEKAGLELVEEFNNIRLSHTILKCKKK